MKQSKGSCPCACYEGIWGSGGVVPLILNFGSWWRWMFFTHRLYLPPGSKPSLSTAEKALWAPESFWALLENRQISYPYRESNYDSSVIVQSAAKSMYRLRYPSCSVHEIRHYPLLKWAVNYCQILLRKQRFFSYNIGRQNDSDYGKAVLIVVRLCRLW
jgi:hypothetical protein